MLKNKLAHDNAYLGDLMSIVINFFGLLASKMATANDSVDLSDGARIRDLLSRLTEKYREAFETYIYNLEGEKISGDVMVNVNDVPILQMQGLDTILNDGDQVDFLPIFAGGG